MPSGSGDHMNEERNRAIKGIRQTLQRHTSSQLVANVSFSLHLADINKNKYSYHTDFVTQT